MRFVDRYLPDGIESYPVDVAPRFSTQIAQVDSGAEQANRRWQDANREISIPRGIRNTATFEALKRHWLVMAGPFRTWPWKDWTDFASVDLECLGEAEPEISAVDQPLGEGDGFETEFQLVKRYDLGPPAEPYDRQIIMPRPGGVLVAIDGTPTTAFTVSRPGGIVTFTVAPADGAVLTAGFYFDLQVRFVDDDSFSGIMQAYRMQGYSDIPLREVPYCAD